MAVDQFLSASMILLLFVLVSAQALPYYAPYPQVNSDSPSVETTQGVGTSLSVLEPKKSSGPMVPAPPFPPMPQPIRVDIIDSNSGQKLGTHNVLPLAPIGYQQPGVPPYSIQYLTFDGNLAPYGNSAVYREPHSANYGYPMQLIQFPQFVSPSNGIYGRPLKKH